MSPHNISDVRRSVSQISLIISIFTVKYGIAAQLLQVQPASAASKTCRKFSPPQFQHGTAAIPRFCAKLCQVTVAVGWLRVRTDGPGTAEHLVTWYAGQIRRRPMCGMDALLLELSMGWGDPRVRLGPNFSTCSGSGWVSQLMRWVGSGHTKWTHGQLLLSILAKTTPTTNR